MTNENANQPSSGEMKKKDAETQTFSNLLSPENQAQLLKKIECLESDLKEKAEEIIVLKNENKALNKENKKFKSKSYKSRIVKERLLRTKSKAEARMIMNPKLKYTHYEKEDVTSALCFEDHEFENI